MRTIAVVEDNPSMLQGLNRLLSAHGFRVQTFTSAELFLDDIAKCEAECLLLDIHLGGISGIEASVSLTVILRVSQCNYGAHPKRSPFPRCQQCE
jgi:FixJ family two-component response regulator